jgi:hypothetical protein
MMDWISTLMDWIGIVAAIPLLVGMALVPVTFGMGMIAVSVPRESVLMRWYVLVPLGAALSAFMVVVFALASIVVPAVIETLWLVLFSLLGVI